MTYLLDTNACIRFLNGRVPRLRERVIRCSPQEIAVCSIVKAELFYGAMRSRNPAETLAKQREFVDQFECFPFDDSAAEVYGRIRASLEASGRPIGPNDLLIASIAVARGVVLVTANTREFARIGELIIEDWDA